MWQASSSEAERGAPLCRRHALNLEAELDILADRAPRQQQVLLQHEGDVRIGFLHTLAVDEHLALARGLEARAHRRSVLLPQPEGPISDTTSPSATAKLTSLTATITSSVRGWAKRLVTRRNSRRGGHRSATEPAQLGGEQRRGPVRRSFGRRHALRVETRDDAGQVVDLLGEDRLQRVGERVLGVRGRRRARLPGDVLDARPDARSRPRAPCRGDRA